MIVNNLFFKKNKIEYIKSFEQRLNSEAEEGDIGYYHLPYLGDEIINEAENFFNNKEYDDIVLVGIGGSSIGIRAIDNALIAKKRKARLHILDNVDNLRFNQITQQIDFKRTIFIISSIKSS